MTQLAEYFNNHELLSYKEAALIEYAVEKAKLDTASEIHQPLSTLLGILGLLLSPIVPISLFSPITGLTITLATVISLIAGWRFHLGKAKESSYRSIELEQKIRKYLEDLDTTPPHPATQA